MLIMCSYGDFTFSSFVLFLRMHICHISCIFQMRFYDYGELCSMAGGLVYMSLSGITGPFPSGYEYISITTNII